MTTTTAPSVVAGSTPQPKARTNYRTDIDGIRGAAAIMVMGFHARVPGFEGAYIGLDLFFVVSGFVITGLLFGELSKTGRISWPAFYARRVRRLIPAKATMLLGVLLLSTVILLPTGQEQDTDKSAAAASMFWSNFYFWRDSNTDYFGHQPGTGVLLHTWSLSVEEQFYLAVPLVILFALWAARRTRLSTRVTLGTSAVVLMIASLISAIALAGSHPDTAYYLPFSRAFEFLMGVALALVAPKLAWLPRWAMQVIGVGAGLLIIGLLVFPMPTAGYPTYWALLPCVGTSLVVLAGSHGRTAVTHFLGIKPLTALGLVSYGWYLWHWPLLVFGEAVNIAPPPLYVRLILIMVALLIAYLSYRFIEGIFYSRAPKATKAPRAQTTRQRRRSVPRPARIVILSGVATMLGVASLAGGAWLHAQSQGNDTHWQQVSAQLNDIPKLPYECIFDTHGVLPTRPQGCHLNDYVEGRPTVVLWGDSHAWMFIPALVEAAAGKDVNLISYTMGGCPPFDEELPPKGSDTSTCQRSNRLALDYVTKEHAAGTPLRVILSASWDDYRDGPTTSLMDQRVGDEQHDLMLARVAPHSELGTPRLFALLGQLGIGTDVVAQTAILPRSAPLCEARALPFSCDVPLAQVRAAQALGTEWLDSLIPSLPPGTRLIDVDETLCDDTVCHAKVGDTIAYFDDDHLSASMSRQLADYFRPSVRAAIRSAD